MRRPPGSCPQSGQSPAGCGVWAARRNGEKTAAARPNRKVFAIIGVPRRRTIAEVEAALRGLHRSGQLVFLARRFGRRRLLGGSGGGSDGIVGAADLDSGANGVPADVEDDVEMLAVVGDDVGLDPLRP